MNGDRSYDPLTVAELGRNAARALMGYDAVPLAPDGLRGAGVYTLHYAGDFEPYQGLRDALIYVGRARHLRTRLHDHERSITQADNLRIADFTCRWLVLAEVWIGLTEDILIGEYSPVWNVIRGFGNRDQGPTRNTQQRSQWDTLHPGRPWAARQQDREGGRDAVLAAIRQHRESQP